MNLLCIIATTCQAKGFTRFLVKCLNYGYLGVQALCSSLKQYVFKPLDFQFFRGTCNVYFIIIFQLLKQINKR
jgi:hypothetical protein